MKLLEKLRAEATGQRRVDEFREPMFSVESHKTDRIDWNGLATREEWVLTGKIHVIFWANSDEYGHARKRAEEVLLSTLYEDVMRELPRLKMAISDGDRAAAFSAVSRIQDALSA